MYVIQGGCRNRDVARECSLHNLHIPAGTNGDTGIGGLMLGGGWGYMSREHGQFYIILHCDISIDLIVTCGSI